MNEANKKVGTSTAGTSLIRRLFLLTATGAKWSINYFCLWLAAMKFRLQTHFFGENSWRFIGFIGKFSSVDRPRFHLLFQNLKVAHSWRFEWLLFRHVLSGDELTSSGHLHTNHLRMQMRINVWVAVNEISMESGRLFSTRVHSCEDLQEPGHRKCSKSKRRRSLMACVRCIFEIQFSSSGVCQAGGTSAKNQMTFVKVYVTCHRWKIDTQKCYPLRVVNPVPF